MRQLTFFYYHGHFLSTEKLLVKSRFNIPCFSCICFPIVKFFCSILFLFSLECILVGSLFWGLWAYNKKAFNYYRAYITKITGTHVDFVLEINSKQTRSYRRTEPVLIIDKIPEMKEVSVNARVIAVQNTAHKEWYRTGNVTRIVGTSLVSVRFDDGKPRKWVPLNELRLVKRPRFCMDNI